MIAILQFYGLTVEDGIAKSLSIQQEDSLALISSFEENPSDSQRRHAEVECGWRYFDVDGGRIFQLDTYGSRERKLTGKQSQSIQLDREGAEELLRILQTAFPGLSR